MHVLSENWLTEGHVDFEYKKYLLLAYLQKVRQLFQKSELYPSLAHLIAHYKNLMDIKGNKASIFNAFPSSTQKGGTLRLRWEHHESVEESEVMKEINDILEYAIPKLKGAVEEGREIYERVESFCRISQIGLSPLYVDEGYVFVEQPPKKETSIYRYQLTVFDDPLGKSRGLHVRHIETSRRGFTNTYEQKKLSLIKRFQDLPNPATYLVSSTLRFPFSATFMPIAKRLLLRQIAMPR